eukprot:7389778-Prymnesium_polylepis.2
MRSPSCANAPTLLSLYSRTCARPRIGAMKRPQDESLGKTMIRNQMHLAIIRSICAARREAPDPSVFGGDPKDWAAFA